MRLCAITDRMNLGSSEPQRTSRLLELVAEWANGGIDLIQVREKDLAPKRLLELTRQIIGTVRTGGGATTRVLLNGAAEIALEAGADGVHLPGGWDAGGIEEVRRSWSRSGSALEPIISVACHSVADAEQARAIAPSLAIFAPVFEKQLESGRRLDGTGLATLETACRAAGDVPVFALGGITAANAASCVAAGASGIAAIRLFCGKDWTMLRSNG
jgi:thiamine-phosphate pyrophosphorylase